MSKIKVIHYPENCIGCNFCVLMAPGQWRINDETGRAELIGGKPEGDQVTLEISAADREANQRAAESCPVQIIKVEESAE